ncbi:MAG: hypothetical protein ACK4TJ_08615 [Tabrizicola sp.]
MVSNRLGEAFAGVETEPALRDRGRADAQARAVVDRPDRQRLSGLAGLLRALGPEESEVLPRAQLNYAVVIGLESLRLRTGQERAAPLWSVVVRPAGHDGAAGRTGTTRWE